MSGKYRIAFVILHYQTYNDTTECIESLLKTVDYPDWYIVVVDNGSPNRSGQMISKRYNGNKQIHVLLTEKNTGFAKGNNAGYEYAQCNLNAAFVIAINSDTVLTQQDFLKKIVDRYELKKYHILGPDIISLKSGQHQNPRKEVLLNKKIVGQYIRYFRYTLLLNYLCIDTLVIRFKKMIVPGSRLPNAGDYNLNPGNNEISQVKLHGSAIVFSPDYLAKYPYAFYPETFLYCEESILYYFVRKDNLITVYYPGVSILHKEDVTSDFLIKSTRMKRRFYLKHNIASAKILYKLYNKQQV